MEIELKYSIPDSAAADRIWEENVFRSFGETSSPKEKKMKAVYFDTEDHVLKSNDVVFRIRLEGSRQIATMKWGGTGGDGLYKREELNIPVSGEDCFMRPSLDVFREDPKGKEMIELVGDKPLVSIVEMAFIRRLMRLDTGNMICEVSVDNGKIITDKGNAPICEMEIELYSGSEDDLIALGDKVAGVYSLERGPKSKFGRGWDILTGQAPAEEPNE